MQTTAIRLKKLTAEDLEAAMNLSCAAGWNQTELDWKFLLNDSQNICLAAVSEEKVIGTAIALDYNAQLGWIGMVLVDKAYRGRGISKLMLQYIFENYKAAVKLDATALGEPVYRKFGFVPEYTVIRMVNTNNENDFARHTALLQQASVDHLSGIRLLDEMALGVNRGNLLEYYLQNFSTSAWVLEENNRITGFVLGRKGRLYHHIGPLVAETTEYAVTLLKQALAKIIDRPFVIDVPADKKEMIQLLQQMGFVEQRRFTRMYKEQNLFAGNTALQFAVAGPEFG